MSCSVTFANFLPHSLTGVRVDHKLATGDKMKFTINLIKLHNSQSLLVLFGVILARSSAKMYNKDPESFRHFNVENVSYCKYKQL